MTIERLQMYKTAYSSTYENYVEIIRVREDDKGEPIIHARPAFTKKEVLFRVNELSEYCL